MIVPPSVAGRSFASPSAVIGKIPSSASMTFARRPRPTVTEAMYRFWKARSSAREASYWLARRSVISSCSSRLMPSRFATFSPVSDIALRA